MQLETTSLTDEVVAKEASAASDISVTDAETPDPSAAEPIVLRRGVDGKLWLARRGVRVAVDVVRCFPWTAPRRFLSLRDADGQELAFVDDLGNLDPESRAVVEETLERASFVLDIVQIRSISEDFELRSWHVVTGRGERVFQTPLDAWPRRLPDGALILEDVYGDLFRVSAPEALDAQSRSLLWAFVD